MVHRREGLEEELARGAIRLAEQFPDDEQVVTAAVSAVLAPGAGKSSDHLDDELVAEVQALVSRYLERWPNGAIRSISINPEDPEGTIETIRQLVEVDANTAHMRRVMQARVARGELPLGFMARIMHRSYTEFLVHRGFGTLPAWSPDPSETSASIRQVEDARDSAVLADLSALTILSALNEATRTKLMRWFRLVQVVDASVADARTGRDMLDARSTVSLRWNEETGDGRFFETSAEEADRQARESQALLALVVSLDRRPDVRAAETTDGQARERHGPWMSTIESAAAAGLPVWVDDVAVRVLARNMGVNAFSTVALLEALERSGEVSNNEHRELLRELAQNRVSVPVTRDFLLEIAEEEGWTAAGAAFSLSSPSLWVNPQYASVLVASVLPSVASHRADQLPDWLYLAAAGIGYTFPADAVAARIGGTVLAAAIHLTGAQPGGVPSLIAAVRAGLLAGASEPQAQRNPLPTAIEILLHAYRTGAPSGTGDQFMIALFSQTSEADRTAVLEAVLRP
jgi:hypothetical protein